MEGEAMVQRVRADLRADAMVLVIDGDGRVIDRLGRTLRSQGFTVVVAATGLAGLQRARTLGPDVIILEVTLPDVSGLEVLRRLREDGITSPVVFLTAQKALQDKVTGLTLGGEDYITKPFSAKEVATRLRVILRRCVIAANPVIMHPVSGRLTVADLELDPDTGHAWRNGEPIPLSPTEFALLHYFMSNPGKALSKTIILKNVWPTRVEGDLNVVEMYVSYLRRKIDTGDTPLLHTLPGVGYVLRAST